MAKVVFIYNGAENLGIEHISSFLKSKGHDVSLLFDPAVFSGGLSISSGLLSRVFTIDDEIVKRAVRAKPDIVAFSTYTGNYRWCLKIARSIKKSSDVPIVFGGVHTTAVPERVLSNDFVDYAIIGEGEYAMLDLVEHLHSGDGAQNLATIPNLCFKDRGTSIFNKPRAYIKDLDSLPLPDKSLFYDKVPLLEENYLIMTSRGCPYDCTYCSNNMYNKIYADENRCIRRRSPGNVIEELLQVKRRGKTRLIAFNDDVFTLSKPWLEEFIAMYKTKIDLPFICSAFPSNITKDIAALLKSGGCWRLTVGIQSGSERVRRDVFNRTGTNEKIIDAISCVKSAGLKLSVDNIFGAPSETEDDLKQGLDLYSRIKPDRMLTFWLTYYPKTNIIQLAKERNILTETDVENIEEGNIGYAFKTGSIAKDKVDLYAKYELLFQLRSLVHNDAIYSSLSKLAEIMPFKRFLSMVVIFINGVVSKDLRLLYLLKYIWAKKATP